MKEADKLGELFSRAREAFDGSDWAKAIELLRQLMSQKPEYPGAQALLGEARKRQSAQIEYEIGLGYFGEKKWPQAIERFETALRDDPEHNDARVRLMEAKRQAGIDRLLNKADQYRRRFEWEQVVTTLKKALELSPGSEETRQQLDDAEVEHLYQVGERHAESKRWRAALDCFEQLEERRPSYKDVPWKLKKIEEQLYLEDFYRRAQDYEQAGMWSRATDLYDQIYSIDPDYKDVVRRLAYCREQSRLQEDKIQAKEDQGKKGKGPLSRRWQFCCFAGGVILAILIVLFWGRDIRCLLKYGTSDGLISLIVILAGVMGGSLASIWPDMSSDTRKALRCISGGAACVLLFIVLWTIVSPPSREECSETTPTPTIQTNTPAPSPTHTATLVHAPTLTLTHTPTPTHTDTPVPSPTPTSSPSPTSLPTPTVAPTPTDTPLPPPQPWSPLTPVPTSLPGYNPSVACVVKPCAPAPRLDQPRDGVELTINSTVEFRWTWDYCLPPGWKFAIRLSSDDPPHTYQYVDAPGRVSCQGGKSVVRYPIKIAPETSDRFTATPGTYYWNIAVIRSVPEGWERLSEESEIRSFMVKPGGAGPSLPTIWLRYVALPLSALGLTMVVVLLYLSVLTDVGRLRQLRFTTVLWLLPHPRHLLAVANYGDYAERWAAGDALERLILLQVPTGAPSTPTQIETELRRLDAAFDVKRLQAAVSALAQRRLLDQEDGKWRLADPLLAQIQHRELPRDEIARLAALTRQEHPLYVEAQRFLVQAGFTVQPADPFGLLCTSDLPLWADVSPLYVRVVMERTLDMDEFQALRDAAQKTYGEDVRGHTAVVVIDRPPEAGDLLQIFALRARNGFTIIPLTHSLMQQARQSGHEMEALRKQAKLYTGHTDLYSTSHAVTDILSFFGRSALLADLERRLTSGRSAVVFGMRKVGKSSLLGRLREECPWSVALIDLEGYAREELKHVYREALRSWHTALEAKFPDLALPEWMDDLTAPDATTQAQAFRRTVMNLLDLLADHPRRPGLLLFLDEIDGLLSQPEYLEFAAVLRSVAEDPRCEGRFALLVAGLEPTLNRVDWMGGRRNPFYAFFGEAGLGPLEPEDACMMVESIGSQMGIKYEDEALDLLVKTGGGHPFLTRQLCSRAVRDLEWPGAVDPARAARAVEEYLHESDNYLAESLWGMDHGGPPPAEAVLLQSLATTQPQPEESLIPPDLSPSEQRARRLALEHLKDQCLIRRVEGGWELTIPLYRRWISTTFLISQTRPGKEDDQ